MARERITFPVNLRQNINDDSTAYGKWFPVPSSSEPMSLKGFAKHLAEHGKLASYDMLVLVLQNVVGCLKELILQGQSVKLDGLGTFRPTIEGEGSNEVELAISKRANMIIKGIHLRFSPENAKGEKLTSRALKDARLYNSCSLGICYEGGLDASGHATDTRTEAQKAAMFAPLKELTAEYPEARIIGQR